MAHEIVNRVANSKLVTFDLEDYYLEGKRMALDISDWLFEGIVLREKEFRTFVKQHDWEQYSNSFLAINCSAEAIIPAWAFMLVSLEAGAFAKKVVIGHPQELETILFSEIINNLDLSFFEGKPVIIKGCTNKPIPENAYVFLSQRLQLVSKSIMYGEACSSVPLYKKS